MIRFLIAGLALFLLSCQSQNKSEERIITVSIAPFVYFVESIAGDDFMVNVMVPPGSNPHVYEPYPDQIVKLGKSEAFISNGFMAFEEVWLERFLSVNNKMITCNIGEKIIPIASEHTDEEADGDHHHVEGADPHYWVSPVAARIIAGEVFNLVSTINPSRKDEYTARYLNLLDTIDILDHKADSLLGSFRGRSFMIYHPNLAYLARDYGLVEVPVEFEGKEPSPSRLKELIDSAIEKGITVIFIQKEYDTRVARVIAGQIGASVAVIDPLSEDWFESTDQIITELYKSLAAVKN